MEFSILGPVEARHNGLPLPLGSGRQRYVLVALLLAADRLVTPRELIDALWEEPPSSAKAQVHNMISDLRRRLAPEGGELISTRPGGYQLRLGSHGFDLAAFRTLVERGNRAAVEGDDALAAESLGDALALWRGPALADLDIGTADDLRQVLLAERLAAAEARAKAELALGRHDDVLRELPGLIAEDPYREGLYEAQMLALVHAGRRADALAVYRAVHRMFDDDLGVAPGAPLRALEQRILRDEEPVAARPALVVPRQLPPAPPGLTGRDDLVAGIRAELRREGGLPAAILVGQGGVGKTALALVAAHGLGDVYPDGQLYADLRGTHRNPAEPHGVIGRFLRALGVDGPAVPDDQDERIALYRSRLAGGRYLVVLDDAGSEAQVRPLLPGSPGCGVVVTSRRRLGALTGMARWPVVPLSHDAAVALLTRVVGGKRVEAEPKEAERIVELCGHLPLAVHVASARLAARVEGTLAEFAARLGAERGRLDTLSVGDLDVRASIALSYQALDAPVRRLFRLLGLVSAPDWPAWVTAKLAGEPLRVTRELVEHLVDVNLVQSAGRDVAGQLRYRLHDLVAEFARERLDEEEPAPERAAARSRLLAAWLELASRADIAIGHGNASTGGLDAPVTVDDDVPSVSQDPMRWFDAERLSLVAAVDEASRVGDPAVAGALALRCTSYLSFRSHMDDRERVIRTVLPRVRAASLDDLLLRLLNVLGGVYIQRDRTADILAVATEQMEVARRLGEPMWESSALIQAGWAERLGGKLDNSARWFRRAVEVAESVSPKQFGRALASLALAHREAGDHDLALPLSADAVELLEDTKSPHVLAWAQAIHAETLLDAGRLAEAVETVESAEEILRELDDELGLAHLRRIRADAHLREGLVDEAAELLRQTVDFVREHQERVGLAEVLRSLGDLALRRGKPEEALAPLHESLAAWGRLSARLEQARVHARLAKAGAGEEHAALSADILADLGLRTGSLRLPPFVVDL